MSEGKRAILIGNAAYPADERLTALNCPLRDIEDLGAILADPKRGGFDPVVFLPDKTSQEVREALEDFLSDAEVNDTVLLYYSGHGRLDEQHKYLYLCSSDTRTSRLKSTSVAFGFVDDLLRHCAATKTAVILDCCFSGAALGSWPKGDLETTINHTVKEGSGSFLLTASGAIETAQEKEGERNGVFTKHVLGGLAQGIADKEGRGVVTMDDLWRHVSRAMSADSKQRPNHESNGHGDIVIVKSGKDSRKERAKRVASILHTRAAKGDLDDAIVMETLTVARKRPSEHTGRDRAIDAALAAFLAKEIPLSTFVVRFHDAPSLDDAEPTPSRNTLDRPAVAYESPQASVDLEGTASLPRASAPSRSDYKLALPNSGSIFLSNSLWFNCLTPILLAVVAWSVSLIQYMYLSGPELNVRLFSASLYLIAAISVGSTIGIIANYLSFYYKFSAIGHVVNGLSLTSITVVSARNFIILLDRL